MATGKANKLNFTTVTTTAYSGSGIDHGKTDLVTFSPSLIPSGYKLHSLRSFVSELGEFIAVPTAMSENAVTVRILNCGVFTHPGTMTAVMNVVPK